MQTLSLPQQEVIHPTNCPSFPDIPLLFPKPPFSQFIFVRDKSKMNKTWNSKHSKHFSYHLFHSSPLLLFQSVRKWKGHKLSGNYTSIQQVEGLEIPTIAQIHISIYYTSGREDGIVDLKLNIPNTWKLQCMEGTIGLSRRQKPELINSIRESGHLDSILTLYRN